jgi:hypothetical protein
MRDGIQDLSGSTAARALVVYSSEITHKVTSRWVWINQEFVASTMASARWRARRPVD